MISEERIKELARNFFETSTEDIDGDIWELVCTVAAEAQEEGIEKMRDKNKRVQEELNECRSKVAQMAVEKRYGQRHNG